MNLLKAVFYSIQDTLFQWIEEPPGPLAEKEKQSVEIISLMNLPEHMKEYKRKGSGRRKSDRLSLIKSFTVRALYNPTCDLLIRSDFLLYSLP